MQKKKLIIAITKGNFGGAQKYVFDLATNLCKDFDLTVITGQSGLLNQKLKNTEIKNKVLNVKNNFNPFLLFTEIAKLGKVLKTEKPDLVHLNSGKMGLVGVIASKLYCPKSKIIFTNHGLVLNEPGINFITKIILKFPYKIIFGLSHRIIAVSEAIKKDSIIICKKSGKKIIVIKNGLENIDFLTKEIVRPKLGHKIQPNDFVIGTIAELHPVKGLEYLINAMPKVILNQPNAKLVIIGSGKLEEKLKRLAVNLNLEEKIIFTGFIDRASKFIKAFNIFVIPSLSEALAYVAIEASLSGVPIIATNVGGIPEIIKDGETGLLVEPKNSYGIAEKIIYLMNDKNKSNELGKNAQNKTIKEFNFDNFINKTKEVYIN